MSFNKDSGQTHPRRGPSLEGKAEASLTFKGPPSDSSIPSVLRKRELSKEGLFHDLHQTIKRGAQALERRHFVNNGRQKGKTKKDRWLT